jgi:hypothetical protein
MFFKETCFFFLRVSKKIPFTDKLYNGNVQFLKIFIIFLVGLIRKIYRGSCLEDENKMVNLKRELSNYAAKIKRTFCSWIWTKYRDSIESER